MEVKTRASNLPEEGLHNIFLHSQSAGSFTNFQQFYQYFLHIYNKELQPMYCQLPAVLKQVHHKALSIHLSVQTDNRSQKEYNESMYQI